MDEFFQVNHASPHYTESDKVTVFYTQSWALTHYFMAHQEGTQRKFLADYLDLVQSLISEIECKK